MKLCLLTDFFHQLYRYREYLKQSVLRDLRNKYKRSVLGYLWTMLHPLGMMTVLAVVFSHIMHVKVEDYAVFVFCGLLPWNYFHSTTMMSLNSIRANARLFGQIAVPKYLFILSIAASNFINFALALVPLVIIMLVFKRPIQPSILFFPFALLPLLFITLGVSLLLATSNVFFDDTLHLAEVGLQALYFLSPILYDRNLLPPHLVQWLKWNPLFQQFEAFRGIFYYGTIPDLRLYGINLVVSFLIFTFCLRVFTKAQDKFLYFV